MMEHLEKEHPAITFAKLDIGDSLGLAGLFGVEHVPTVFFIKKGKIVKMITGLKSFEELADNTRDCYPSVETEGGVEWAGISCQGQGWSRFT
jgi:thioredoxin-like negative regulator of GroEL